jgi:2-phospho-L-lactate/phosphoenolpyruvate guanylyltransferase
VTRCLSTHAFTIGHVSPSARPQLSNVHAILPIRSRDAAKTRLGLALDPEERDVLVVGMLAQTIHVLARWTPCRSVHVVTSDSALLDVIEQQLVSTFGPVSLDIISDPGTGLNDALVAGRLSAMQAGATAVLMLPADLPLLNVESLDGLLDAADATIAAGNGAPVVVMCAADARTGTNALLLSPVDVIEPHFGPQSFEAHLRAAAIADASVQIVDDARLSFDLDTPDDLERLEPSRLMEIEALGEQILGELVFSAAG